ncbi:pyridoxamine 5'-phosphate oxidase [Bacteroidota bacterium]
MGNFTDKTEPNPFHLFRQWYLEAVDSDISDPTIMSLATVGKEGRPSGRIVLLKDFDERGFVFYTNYMSRKARQLEDNPWASLVFHWHRLGRQVRIEGRIEQVSREESDKYFSTRPRGSQLGAWASDQSQVVDSRESLDRALHMRETEFTGKEIPRPPHWGGYRLVPDRLEFWISRENRMHDRILYIHENKGWISRRLAP